MKLLKPHKKQLQVFNSPLRYKVLNWGRRSGKSVLAGEYAFVEALKNQGRYFIVAPTYKQAKSIYWNDILKTIIPKKVIAKTNDTELYIEFHHIKGDIKLPTGETIQVEHDPNKPASRIELKGADNPDSLRGVGLHGAILDEYAFMKDGKEIWDKILRPALADNQGWAIFISTPNGTHNHFHELILRAEKSDTYFFSHATALDNPHFPPEEFEIAREETPEDEFMQEWMADFRSMTTAVYPRFSRNKHMVNPKDIPAEGTDIIGIDFGHTDPFAAVFVRIDKNQNWWIVDEIYEENLDLEQIANRLRDKMGDVYYTRIIGDSSGATEIDTLKKVYNLPIIGAKKGKDTIKAGIREVSQKLKIREGTGKPKLFVSSVCSNTIREFEAYERISTKDAYGETIVSETPEDKNNHAMDALRYLALDHSEYKKPRVRRKREFDRITGRALS